MRFRIAMEIAMIADRLPVNLIVKGYRYSRHGAVAFILNEIKPELVNRILDPVVPTMSLNIPGVHYIDIKAGVRVHEVLLSSKAIIMLSPHFYELMGHQSLTEEQAVVRTRTMRILTTGGSLCVRSSTKS